MYTRLRTGVFSFKPHVELRVGNPELSQGHQEGVGEGRVWPGVVVDDGPVGAKEGQ